MPTEYTVTGTYIKGTGSPARGQLSFYPSVASRHAGDGIILSTDEIDVDLDEGGKFSISLYATDDAGWSNVFKWTVRERIIDGVSQTYQFDLTADLDLATVDPSAAV